MVTANRNERRRAAKETGALARGFAAHQRGDLKTAAMVYRKILADEPDAPEATRLLAEVLISTGHFDEALRRLDRLVAQHERHFSGHYTRGNALRLSGRTAASIAAYQTALALQPGFAGALHGLGLALKALDREAEAAEAFADAARADPNWALAWGELGLSLAALGRLDIAAEALRRSLALDPGQAELRRHLLALAPPAAQDRAEEARWLQAVLDDERAPETAKIETGFALGKLLDGAARYDAAFATFAAANRRLRRQQAASGQVFNREKLARDVDALIAAFPARAPAGGSGTQTPVFVAGMPRAGSSLVEQILASHGQVFGLGEFTGIGAIAHRLGWRPASWTAAALAAEAGWYSAETQMRAGGALRVVDKMPDNIFQLGLIAALFPQARIIFCARDPLDTCFSCFTQRFAQPLAYDTDLGDCGFRYAQVERLTRHWQAVLPLKMLTVSYESLVGDLETEARRMVDFLGLAWDPACLAFDTTARTVRTASWAQVRQKLYHHAIGRAAHYSAHLAPLLAELKTSPGAIK